MEIEVSEDLLAQFQAALAKKQQVAMEGRLVDTEVKLLTERILRQGGVSNLDAELHVDTEKWTFSVVEPEDIESS